MNLYLFIKIIHVSCVTLSIMGFIIRGVWMIRDSTMLSHRLVKILPHIIDAVLLLSAILLAYLLEQYPFYHHWLTVKVIALLVYIFLGMFAFSWAKTKPGKVTYWVLAVMVYVYIISVAFTKQPLWFVA